MQREKAWLVLLYGVAAIAILLPIAVAIRLADYQSLFSKPLTMRQLLAQMRIDHIDSLREAEIPTVKATRKSVNP